MAHVLTMPGDSTVPPYLPETQGQAFALFRHYELRQRGIDIFVMSDGSVVTDRPVQLSVGPPATFSVTGSPYPWNPTQSPIDTTNPATGGEQPPVKGSFPYVHVDNPLASPEVLEVSTSPYCVSWFRGGVTSYTISNAMYAILLAAGFTNFLS
jgi:hypothetical protein